MNEPQTLPAADLTPYMAPRDKWERERQAFFQLLPELLKTHRGQYVAVHEGHIVDSGADKIALALRAYDKYGYIPIFVSLVTDRPLVPERCPSFRVLERE